MSIWKDAAGGLHDDMGGKALSLPGWPAGMTKLTDTQAAAAMAPTIEQLKAMKLDELRAACSAAIYAVFTSSALGGVAHTYPALDRDQANLTASVLASTLPNLPVGWTTSFWCADAAGVWAFRAHTAAEIQQVGLDGTAALRRNADLAIQVQNATTKTAVGKIVW